MPAFEVGITPRWNRWQNLLPRARHAVRAQGGGNQLAHNARIERITRKADTAVAKQIARGAAATSDTWSHMQQRKITGAAAEVANHNQLIVIEGGLIGVGGGDGLHFEFHPLISRKFESVAQPLQRIR